MSPSKWRTFPDCDEMQWTNRLDATWEGPDPPLLALEIEEGVHKPKNDSGLEKLEEAKKQILS